MSWAASIFSAILTSIATCIAGGTVALGCVDWFHISPREGGSGYFVVFMGLLSGFAGFIGGLVISRFAGGPGAGGFFKGTGISWAVMVGLAAVVALICRLLGDVAPTIDGKELNLEIEGRMPVGEPQPVQSPDLKSNLSLDSVNSWNHVQRERREGTLDVAGAKLLEGRWHILGSVFLFTERGDRVIDIELNGKSRGGFVLPIPRRPGSQSQEWSRWMPIQSAPGKPWPDTEVSVRWRVQQVQPPPPEPDPEEARAAAFAALTPDAPIEKWLSFLRDSMPQERADAILKVLDERPADFAKVIVIPDMTQSDSAIQAVLRMKTIHPEVIEALRTVEKYIADEIRRFNAMKPDEAGYIDLASNIRDRVATWHPAWWAAFHLGKFDGKPEYEEVLKLARVHNESGHMREVVLLVKTDLEALTSPAK